MFFWQRGGSRLGSLGIKNDKDGVINEKEMNCK